MVVLEAVGIVDVDLGYSFVAGYVEVVLAEEARALSSCCRRPHDLAWMAKVDDRPWKMRPAHSNAGRVKRGILRGKDSAGSRYWRSFGTSVGLEGVAELEHSRQCDVARSADAPLVKEAGGVVAVVTEPGLGMAEVVLGSGAKENGMMVQWSEVEAVATFQSNSDGAGERLEQWGATRIQSRSDRGHSRRMRSTVDLCLGPDTQPGCRVDARRGPRCLGSGGDKHSAILVSGESVTPAAAGSRQTAEDCR